MLINEMAQNDSQVALRSLFLYYYPKLLLYVSYYIKSRQVAEEVVSETFVVVWEQRAKLINVHNINSYIYTIARNLSVNHLRSETKHLTNVAISEMDYIAKSHMDPENDLISSELANSLDLAVESLPEKCKMAFKLVREHQLKYKEAAEIMEISVKTLEAHIALAIKKLREVFHNEIYH